MTKIRVLLADDHETILAREHGILGEDFVIVGAVTNGRDAVEEVRRLEPDVLVIELAPTKRPPQQNLWVDSGSGRRPNV